jgi:hypothetical protein
VTQVKVDERWMEWWCMLEGKVIHICAYMCVCVRPDQGTKAYGCWLLVDRGVLVTGCPIRPPATLGATKSVRACLSFVRSVIYGEAGTLSVSMLSHR